MAAASAALMLIRGLALVTQVDWVLVVAAIGDAISEFGVVTELDHLDHQFEIGRERRALPIQRKKGLAAVHDGEAIEL